MRSHWCGELRPEHVGEEVTLCGWVSVRREHGEHLAFVDLRDRTGIVQCVVDHAHDLRREFVVRITGTVRNRPGETINTAMATGEIEVGDCTVEILSAAEPPPFPIDARGDDTDESVRLRYRYLDLRRERLQRNLRVRADVNSAIRGAMERQGFTEVETPMLMPSTPEGAREFLVPARQQPGSFYALPQSPQLFKQLLMVGGMERYYQIARCLRDEDLRADRQYEFMQLDMEMSFVDQDDVLDAISESVLDAAERVTGVRPGEIRRITWHDAMDRHGSDKPDLRFGMELTELTPVFAATEFNAFAAAGAIKGIRVPGEGDTGRKRLDALTDDAKKLGAKGLVWMRVRGPREVDSPVAKFLTEDEIAGVVSALGAEPGDLALLVADEWHTTCEVLGGLRNQLGRPPVSEGPYEYVWVVDFPMFVGVSAEGHPKPAHHPFTRPHPEDVDKLESDPMSVRSRAYDLVLNGWELGSGSIRIHEPELQQRIFTLLGISAEEADRRFGFFLSPFRYGAPPHGGFAFGIDRLAAILAGEDNIREVIAFPKPQSGLDPMTGAPTAVADAQLRELGIRTLPTQGLNLYGARMERRDFLKATVLGGTTFAIGSAWPRVFAGATGGPGPYGPLQAADANGFMLPAGFTSRVVATTNVLVPGTTYTWHTNPDGGATFATDDGGWIYTSNSESFPGGAGMVRFDAAGNIVDARRILSGTIANCAGGPTPWGTWLSCEEVNGQVWECDPAGVNIAVVRPAMGRFWHEAAAVDPVRQHVYLTEDQPDGGLFRFVPTTYPDLSAGTLEVLTETGGVLGWATVPDPDGAPTPCRDQVATMKVFNGGEGCWYDSDKVYFTTKGDNRVWTYDPVANSLTIIYDNEAALPPPVLTGVDNVTVARSGDVYVAEDAGDMELWLLSPEGDRAAFCRLTGVTGSEMTGPAFSPDGSRLYVSSQRSPGRTYEITGPFRESVPLAPVVLAATKRTRAGNNFVDLTWTGAVAPKVRVLRNGSLLTKTANDGAYTDKLGTTTGTFVYRVTDPGGAPASNKVTVTFP